MEVDEIKQKLFQRAIEDKVVYRDEFTGRYYLASNFRDIHFKYTFPIF